MLTACVHIYCFYLDFTFHARWSLYFKTAPDEVLEFDRELRCLLF